MTFGPINTISSYIPTEFQVEGDQKFFQELIAERQRLVASVVNIKENGNYELRELLSAMQWFSTNTAGQPYKARYGFRTVVDAVALNGGVIGAGATALVLTTTTIPPAIVGYTIPLPSHGSATATDGTSIFLNDPQVFFRFNGTTNTLTITNNYGANLTQCYIDIEYLKQ
jgi:hypothetical protein